MPVSQDAPFRARKSSGFVEISTNQGVAPAASCRMLTFEIDFADSRGAAILSRAIFQGHLRGPNAPFRARKGSGFVEISTNQGVALIGRKNTLTKLGRHLVSCSLRFKLRTGVKLCVKVDRTSIMKSREYNDTKKSGGLLRKNRSCTYFKARSFACPSGFESVFGFGSKKASLKYRHRSLWNVTT